MIISKNKLAKALGVSTRTLDRMAHRVGDFPKKVRITPQRVGYRMADVERYFEEQVA